MIVYSVVLFPIMYARLVVFAWKTGFQMAGAADLFKIPNSSPLPSFGPGKMHHLIGSNYQQISLLLSSSEIILSQTCSERFFLLNFQIFRPNRSSVSEPGVGDSSHKTGSFRVPGSGSDLRGRKARDDGCGEN